MSRCRYRAAPTVDPRRPRCLLDEGHEGDHAPDVAGQVGRGRPPTPSGAGIDLRLRVPRSAEKRASARGLTLPEAAREALRRDGLID